GAEGRGMRRWERLGWWVSSPGGEGGRRMGGLGGVLRLLGVRGGSWGVEMGERPGWVGRGARGGEKVQGPGGSSWSGAMDLMMRSRSSRVANSTMILPLLRPMSTRTLVS